MEYIRIKRKYNELPPMHGIDIIDKNNLPNQMACLEITKKIKTESGVQYKHYYIPLREYMGEDERNNSLDTACELPFDPDAEKRIVEDYYKKKNSELFKQMFG